MLRCYQRDIARFIHSQMQDHYWEETVDYEVVVSKGFTELKESAYSYLVAETTDTIFMLEPKASNQMDDPIVLAKKEAAVKWCANASNHAQSYNGKPWRYVLIPHNEIVTNMTLGALAARFGE